MPTIHPTYLFYYLVLQYYYDCNFMIQIVHKNHNLLGFNHDEIYCGRIIYTLFY